MATDATLLLEFSVIFSSLLELTAETSLSLR